MSDGQERGIKGLGSISQRKDGLWIGRYEAGYTASGNRRRLTVSASTRKECRAKLNRKIKEASLGAAPVSRDMDVKRWIDTWLDDRAKKVRPKTYLAESGPLRRHVVPAIGKIKLSNLTTDDIRTFRSAMETDGCSSTLIRYTQRVFQQSLKSAIKEGKTVPEGVIMFERPDAEVSDRTAIPLPDSVRLAAMAASFKADSAKGVQDGSRWIAALLQGMRQGECLGLTWDNVDFEKNVIIVRWQLQELPYKDRAAVTFQLPPGLEVRHLTERFHLTPPKSRRGYRVIPMVEPMRDAMLDWRDRWPENSWNLVWAHPSINVPENKHRDLAGWKALQDAAGVHKGVKMNADGKMVHTHYVLHEARNSTATLLMAAKVDPIIITQILGHASIVTSQQYMTVSQDQTRAALDEVARLLQLTPAPTA